MRYLTSWYQRYTVVSAVWPSISIPRRRISGKSAAHAPQAVSSSTNTKTSSRTGRIVVEGFRYINGVGEKGGGERRNTGMEAS